MFFTKSTNAQVVVVDFGSQVTQLIARRCREQGVAEIVIPYHQAGAYLNDHAPKLVFLSGGYQSVYANNAPQLERRTLDQLIARRVTIVGICYGMQLIAQLLGGRVTKGKAGEYGRATLNRAANAPAVIWTWPEKETTVWMSHSDEV